MAFTGKNVVCMVFARSAAMSFNRYLDRSFDALNPRTAKREIPAGIIKPQHALLFTIISSVLFVATTLHVFSASFVIAAGITGHFNFVYWIGAAFYMSMLTYQHLLVKPNDLS